ncbi:MAG: hypothetical protein JWM10_5162 [Myxococcaceae bacterium]|nr:hypothetical protein [Myxococcaceae bacterium]
MSGADGAKPPLPFSLAGGVGRAETLDSPSLPPGALGLLAGFDQLHREGDVVSFRLLVTWALPADVAASYHSMSDAMVVVARDARSHRVAALRLVDPGLNRIAEVESNFTDRLAPEPSAVTARGHVAVTLAALIEAAPGHPGLLVHVALREHCSNLLRIPVAPAGGP